MDDAGVAFGRTSTDSGSTRAVRWTLEGGLEDISLLEAPWYDTETGSYAEGFVVDSVRDVNSLGQRAGGATCGETRRAYVYDDITGYTLLPQPYERDDGFTAWSINDYGEVQGSAVNGSGMFIWSSTSPSTAHFVDPTRQPKGIGDTLFTTWESNGYPAVALRQFSFLFVDGVFNYDLMTTISSTQSILSTLNNKYGNFAYTISGGVTQVLWFHRPGQSPVKVSESTILTPVTHVPGWRVNDSGDFMYRWADVPYLYRRSEARSYRLYDISDSYTKGALFVDSSGTIKDSTISLNAPHPSDDDVSGMPAADPFDTLIGRTHTSAGVGRAVVLTPIPK
jgi:hypothetical protein